MHEIRQVTADEWNVRHYAKPLYLDQQINWWVIYYRSLKSTTLETYIPNSLISKNYSIRIHWDTLLQNLCKMFKDGFFSLFENIWLERGSPGYICTRPRDLSRCWAHDDWSRQRYVLFRSTSAVTERAASLEGSTLDRCPRTLCWHMLHPTAHCWLGSLDHCLIDSNQCWCPLQGGRNTWPIPLLRDLRWFKISPGKNHCNF